MRKLGYIVAFRLTRPCAIRVGRLGRFAFPAGTYHYVGSAQRARSARVARHARRRKPLRWHIDYLSVRARFMRAWLVGGDRQGECALARRLARACPRHIAGFGASDCGCGGHLFKVGSDARKKLDLGRLLGSFDCF